MSARRSSRSIATGPGSRGGTWHVRATRPPYYRTWRAMHPDYVERDNRRRAETRRAAALERDRAYVDELARR